MTVIILTPEEVALADAEALRRARRGLSRGNGHGEAHEDRLGEYHLGNERRGCRGEFAFARWAGRPWNSDLGDFTGGDVEGGYEVRSTMYRSGHLIAYPSDPDDRRIVLAVQIADPYEWTIAGWILGREAKLDRFLPPAGKLREGSPPQWWIPQYFLRSALALRAAVAPADEPPDDLRALVEWAIKRKILRRAR